MCGHFVFPMIIIFTSTLKDVCMPVLHFIVFFLVFINKWIVERRYIGFVIWFNVITTCVYYLIVGVCTIFVGRLEVLLCVWFIFKQFQLSLLFFFPSINIFGQFSNIKQPILPLPLPLPIPLPLLLLFIWMQWNICDNLRFTWKINRMHKIAMNFVNWLKYHDYSMIVYTSLYPFWVINVVF